MTVTRFTALAVAGAFAAVTVGACSSGDETAADGLDPVTAIVMPYLTMMPFHIAAEEGYFEEQGLDVRFRQIARNQDMMATLAHGDVDVAAGMLTVNELSLVAAGAHLRMVASLGELSEDGCPFVAVVVRAEHRESGALTDPEQVRALRYDFNRILPLAYFLDSVLAPLGLDSDDLDSVDLPPVTAVEALRAGEVDVTVDSDPFVTMHTADGHAVVWGALQETFSGYPVSLLMYGPTMVDERPDVGERFATAMLKGIRRASAGKTAENVSLVERAIGLTPEIASSACWPTFPRSGRINAAAFDGYQQWSVEHGMVDRVLAEDELFDHRFIDYANAELGP